MELENSFDALDLLDNQGFINYALYGTDKVYWTQYSNKSESAAIQVCEARDFILSIHELDAPMEITATSNDVWSGIQSHIKAESKTNESYSTVLQLAAACVAILLVVGFAWKSTTTYSIEDNSHIVSSEERWIEYTNDSATNWPVNLADGSQVILEPNAYIKYPIAFDQKTRKVLLKGDAFFDIERDTFKPFYVYANEAVIRVLGTSFFVKAEDDDKDVEVIVKTGKVAVYRSKEVKEYQTKTIKEIDPIIVTPNQIATLKKSNLEFNKRLVATPTLIRPLKQLSKTHFEDSSIHEVIEALELAYGVEIEVDKRIHRSCQITTTLSDEPLFEKLKIICDPLGLNYIEKDVKIYITGICHN